MIEPAGEAMAKLKFIVLAELALLFCVLVFLFYRTRSQGTLLEGYEVRSTTGVYDNLWKAVGVNVESRRYIDVSGGGEILDDVQAYRSNLLIRNQFDDVDLKVRETSDVIRGGGCEGRGVHRLTPIGGGGHQREKYLKQQ